MRGVFLAFEGEESLLLFLLLALLLKPLGFLLGVLFILGRHEDNL